jgi:hypothetical protein
MPSTGLTGSLKTMSLPDLLQWAGSGRKTGTLTLKSGPLHKKIYFQTLLIAKIVELLAHPTVGLAFEYFCCDEAFEQRPQE